MSSSRGHLLATGRRRIAVTVSVTIHGAALWLLAETQAPWLAPPARDPLVATLVFVERPARPDTPVDRTPPPPQDEPPAFREALTAPAEETNADNSDPATSAARDESPAPEDETSDEVPPAPAEDNAAEQPQSSVDEAVAEAPDAPAGLPGIDFRAAGEAAVDAVLDRRNAEAAFSGDDLLGNDPASDGGSTVRSPFESDLPRAAAIRPNRSGSALVRRIGRLCEGLTGGISLFGIVALCTDAYGRRDLFADIRPDYLDELPECEEVELSAAAQAMAIDAGLPTTPVKCRMVHRDERYRD